MNRTTQYTSLKRQRGVSLPVAMILLVPLTLLGVTLANRNTPGQGVLSGSTVEIEKAAVLLEQQGLRFKKLSVAASLNEANRTVPVYFEFNNPQNKIKVGMYAEVYLKVGKANEYISIPESTIINEDGLHTSYVQIEGEAFEKRILKTGIIDNGYVQVIDGLKVGERVVTVGAYQVRLAALSPESAIGQGHVH